jgi:pimeloyl-ACP methyl ester carboxylesterase
MASPRGPLWLAIALLWLLSSLLVHHFLFFSSWIALALFTAFATLLPLQSLLLSVSLYIRAGSPLLALFLWATVGVQVGCGMLLASRFLPSAGCRAAFLVATSGVSDVLLSLWPRSPDTPLWRALGVALGIPFTLVTELCIFPVAVVVLSFTAALKRAGEDFDSDGGASASSVAGEKKTTLVVLIHGNGFNECQWLYGRLLLNGAPFAGQTSILTVNYFGGPLLRKHNRRTRTVEGCSDVVMGQIDAQLKARGSPRFDKVVLMGHSLGGVVSSYIAEHYKTLSDGSPVTSVIARSAPLGGSALLHFAKRSTFLSRLLPLRGGIHDDFCPSSKKLVALRASIAQSAASGRVHFTGITGFCDPLVRPESALPPGLSPRVHLPHLGHYNIKISVSAWRAALSAVAQAVAKD